MTRVRARREDVVEKQRIDAMLVKHRERLAALQGPIARARAREAVASLGFALRGSAENRADVSALLDELRAAKQEFLRDAATQSEKGSRLRTMQRAFDRAIDLAEALAARGQNHSGANVFE